MKVKSQSSLSWLWCERKFLVSSHLYLDHQFSSFLFQSELLECSLGWLLWRKGEHTCQDTQSDVGNSKGTHLRVELWVLQLRS